MTQNRSPPPPNTHPKISRFTYLFRLVACFLVTIIATASHLKIIKIEKFIYSLSTINHKQNQNPPPKKSPQFKFNKFR